MNEFQLFHMDMRDFIYDESIPLLITSTPAPEATSNQKVKEQLEDFLRKVSVDIIIVDCEPILIDHPHYFPWVRGTYSQDHKCRIAIENLTKPGDIVIDPYCGGSRTGEAALYLKRRYIGIDIDADSIKKSEMNCQAVLEGINPREDEYKVP